MNQSNYDEVDYTIKKDNNLQDNNLFLNIIKVIFNLPSSIFFGEDLFRPKRNILHIAFNIFSLIITIPLVLIVIGLYSFGIIFFKMWDMYDGYREKEYEEDEKIIHE